jgi:hypothetical protein
MTAVAILFEDINPTPWMAKDLSVGRKPGGKVYPQAHSPAAQVAYQSAISESFAAAYPEFEPFRKGTPLFALFYFWRKLDQYKTPTGRNQTAHRVDATNSTKSTEDALQKLVYHNDVDNTATLGWIMQQGTDVEPAVLVIVDPLIRSHYVDRNWIDMTRQRIKLSIAPPMPPGNVYLAEQF